MSRHEAWVNALREGRYKPKQEQPVSLSSWGIVEGQKFKSAMNMVRSSNVIVIINNRITT